MTPRPQYTFQVFPASDAARVSTWIAAATRIVVLTGAGISTDSGIPDFRGPQGVWTKNPQAEKLSNIHDYMADPEVRRQAWKARINHPALACRSQCRPPRAVRARTPADACTR